MQGRRRVLIGAWLLVFVGLVAGQEGRRGAAQDFVFPGEAERLPPAVAGALDEIHTPALATHLAFLASPAMDGRGLGSQGLEASMEYVAAMLALGGVAPLREPVPGNAAAAYFQEVALREVRGMRGALTVATPGPDGKPVERARLLSGPGALFPEMRPGSVSGPLVFAGYGIRESSPARDDYRGLDVRGKVVVVLAGVPPGPEWGAPGLAARYAADGARQRWAAKRSLAASLGARAVLAVEGAEASKTLASSSRTSPPFFVLAEDDPAAIPVVRVSAAAGSTLLRAAGVKAGSGPVAAKGAAAAIRVTGQERALTSRNAIGVIRGEDPKFRAEAVLMGAHVDHLGRAGERYYPGADDNASGTASLLEIARALASRTERPRRTVVVAFWTGEEEGHLGSEHYARHPLWPLERTSVYLNLDMIGHPWSKAEIEKLVREAGLPRGDEFVSRVTPADFVELGVAEWAPDVADLLLRAARGAGLSLRLDRTDGTSGGSDYREFARRGLPWVRFFGNYFEGYHEPTDTVENLDVGQVRKIARLALASAWLLADR